MKPRWHLESAVLNDRVYLWGGVSPDGEFHPRNLIYEHSLTSGEWKERRATGDVPPPCCRARCEVIGDTVFTYGGMLEDGSHSTKMHCLDTTSLSWSLQKIAPTSEAPPGRSSCSFVALNSETLLLFGGHGPATGQSGAWILEPGVEPGYNLGFNNELYRFSITGGEWESLELKGSPPEPRCGSAMAPFDDHRALLHGGKGSRTFDDFFIVDIGRKEWVTLLFGLKPPPRCFHTLSRFHYEKQPFFLLLGGETSSGDFDPCAYYYNFIDSRWSDAPFEDEQGERISCSIAHHSVSCVCIKDHLAVVAVSGMQLNNGATYFQLYQKVPAFFASQLPIRAMKENDVRIAELERDYDEAVSEREKVDVCWQSLYNAEVARSEASMEQYGAALAGIQEKHETVIRTLFAEMQGTVQSIENSRVIEVARAKECQIIAENALLSLAEVQKEHSKCTEPLFLNPKHVIENEQEKLGSGSFGAVYSGSFLGEPVAVKALNSRCSNADARQEILTLHRLRHPNVVTIYGIVELTTGFRIVAERLEGSLAELLNAAWQQRQALKDSEKMGIAKDVVKAVVYLHNLRTPYVHGDIRPTNVLLTNAMTAKLGDLGAAHRLGSASGGPLSKHYLAPERNSSPPSPSSLASDIYSLGVTSIELFLCEAPSVSMRQNQLMKLKGTPAYTIFSKMISDEADKRSEALECLHGLRHGLRQLNCGDLRRKVQGQFEGEDHKLVIICTE